MSSVFNLEKQERLFEKLRRECGPYFLKALEDPNIIEILLNPDGKLWIEHKSLGLMDAKQVISPVNAMNLIGTVADLRGKLINEEHEILETEFPLSNSRFEATIPDVSSTPCFSLRKKAICIFTMEDYLKASILNKQQFHAIREAITNRESLLIVGGPGTGKTTLANAILNEMVIIGDPNQRFVIIEDTRELQCSAPNTLYLKTTKNVDFQQLLRVALRSRPDKICMGECRGIEMLTLLKAWNTGTPGGLATLHANSAHAALVRITEMVSEASQQPLPYLISEAVNVIISIMFDPQIGRRVNEVLKVTGFDGQQFHLKSLLEQ